MNELITILNRIIEQCEPLRYEDFNKVIKGKDLEALEASNPKVGITFRDGDCCVTTLSLIATITDYLCDKRLSFIVDDGFIKGVQWYDASNV